uniref:Putative secreted protein n=1 Tax=Anopheles darlingi TaxID=43151 RepID=A0A2M4DIR1_ANODA
MAAATPVVVATATAMATAVVPRPVQKQTSRNRNRRKLNRIQKYRKHSALLLNESRRNWPKLRWIPPQTVAPVPRVIICTNGCLPYSVRLVPCTREVSSSWIFTSLPNILSNLQK